MKVRYIIVAALLASWTVGCGQSSSPTMPTAACSYLLAPDAQAVEPSGGTFEATMTTTGTCGWAATADVPWIEITSGASGVATGRITYSVAANPGPIRRGTITSRVTGSGAPVTVTVIQSGDLTGVL